MSYAEHAKTVMLETLLTCRQQGLNPVETAQTIDAAYPFGPRSHGPYRAWLSVRREFFAAHGLPRRGDHKNAANRKSDLIGQLFAATAEEGNDAVAA